MSEFWIGFVAGVLSSSFVATAASLVGRGWKHRQNSDQWSQIRRCLVGPGLIRAVGGSATLMGHINTTRWTITVEPFIHTPFGDGPGTGIEYRLGTREWEPTTGTAWQISADVRKALENHDSKVYVNISYEPIYKNIGSVNGVPVGERVNLSYLDFSPESGEPEQNPIV